MDKKEIISKKIDIIIDTRKILWANLLFIGAGVIGLALSIIGAKDNTAIIFKSLLALVGTWIEYIFIICINDNAKELDKLTKLLESEE